MTQPAATLNRIADRLNAEAEATLESRQREDYREALKHPYAKSLKPLSGRLLVTTPHLRASNLGKTSSGLIKAETAVRHDQELGLICTVVSVGADVAAEIVPGTMVVVPWFAGVILLDEDNSTESGLWAIGDGDVMFVHGDRIDVAGITS